MLNYVVDPEGNTYEIEATTYAGDRSFVDAAKTAARRYKYMTSHFNGEPLHSSAVNEVTFRLFRKQVSATTEQINQTLATLTDLGFTYLYEDVFLVVVNPHPPGVWLTASGSSGASMSFAIFKRFQGVYGRENPRAAATTPLTLN